MHVSLLGCVLVHPHMYVFFSVWSGTSSFDLSTLIPLRLGANTGLGLGCTDNAPIKVPTEHGLRERKYVKEISVPALVSILSPLSQVVIVPLCSPILSVWLSMAINLCMAALKSQMKQGEFWLLPRLYFRLFVSTLSLLSLSKEKKNKLPLHTHMHRITLLFCKECSACLPVGSYIW